MKFRRLLYMSVMFIFGIYVTGAQEVQSGCSSSVSASSQKILHTYLCHADLLWNLLLTRADAQSFKYAQALERLQSLQLRHPQQSALYTLRGEVHLLLYEWDNALADFNRAIALDPLYAPAYFQRGVLWATQGAPEAALADFNSYLALQPNGPYAQAATHYRDQLENATTPPGT